MELNPRWNSVSWYTSGHWGRAIVFKFTELLFGQSAPYPWLFPSLPLIHGHAGTDLHWLSILLRENRCCRTWKRVLCIRPWLLFLKDRMWVSALLNWNWNTRTEFKLNWIWKYRESWIFSKIKYSFREN